jgi:hypothetical protein
LTRIEDFSILDYLVGNLGDGRSVKSVKNGAKRLHPKSGRAFTSLPSWLMQTAHGALAQRTRTDTAVFIYLLGTRSLGSNFDLSVTSAVLIQGVRCTRQPSQANAWLTVRLGELR